MTHGHGLRGEEMVVRGEYSMEGNKGRRKWDNSNSIINKIYLKSKKRK